MEKFVIHQNLLCYIIGEINNTRIKELEMIISNYKSLKKNNVKNIKNVDIKSDLITEFFSIFNENFDYRLEKDIYEFNESLNKVYDLSKTLFVKTSRSVDEKIIVSSIKRTIILLFQDYLLKKDTKYRNAIKNSMNHRNNIIFSRIDSVSKKIKLIKLYSKKSDSLDKYIQTINLNMESLNITLNEEYEYLSSNMITDFLYNDKDSICKLKYLIDFLNNSRNFDFNSLNISYLFDNSIDNNMMSKGSSNNYFYKLGFTFCFLLLITSNVASKNYKEKNLCLNDVYTTEIAEMCINEFFDGDVLSLSISKEQLDEFKIKSESLTSSLVKNKLDLAYRQYDDISMFKEKLRDLFMDDELLIVKNDVSIKERYELYNFLIGLPQKDFVQENLLYIDRIDEVINKREIVELTNISFVSQKEEKIYNGCEAASLLMALKYHNMLENYMLKDFVEYMPMHENDPYQGFIYSIYDYYPTNVAHWVAPPALARFGSNYLKSVDISGSDVEILKENINNNKPVIVYITAGFEKPIITSQEVPRNLHVVLLVGYNKVTGEYIIYDPYYGKLVIEKEKFEASYNHLKYAVSVG